MDYMKKEYFKMMGDKILLSQEDLTINEKTLIEFSYFLFTEKLEEIKLLNDENRRISIELSNLKTYLEDLNSDIREND